ncbi:MULTISPECIES: hypothetical protein [unclassified Ruegeria]|uniref:hypothetical protein n=1 Tax=unclassified Ruegeria TaxID=2625375 RepID=UPI001489F986|nr:MULTISPECIES: hypothetical protein [unclassified Ruegeria]NOD46532.1 hypothetical protein [Ruegeria sp. HKCCD5849]NOD50168.1 hypothetical protein [Ruegeria sp. HKCCD5851]NOD63060.1 hypothetical protein [Ruegeria sp. HKCCD6109]NOD67003.1 hypothetical protein [Ruegeria sp. HKCCD7303]NOE32592.1 hypothetical protein [Ruegeria sp. HKCCD7318]
MNANRIIDMIVRQVMRRLVNKGVNKGIDMASRMGKGDATSKGPKHANSSDHAQKLRQAEKMSRQMRRFMKF